ncbi:MAG: dihydroorotase [Deltaproteobacteria bacterium]|nr:dihydroorotase [Deltaproteobacteria bacterium]
MSETFDLILSGGHVFTPAGIQTTNIAIKDGKIAGLGDFDTSQAKRTILCAGLTILPGLIDTQVHFREPGATHKETLATGMKSAALGGITAVFEMPNTNPLTLTPDAIADKMTRAAKEPWVDYAFYLGGCKENAQHLAAYENTPGICGIKVFMGASTGDLLAASDEEIEAVLSNGKRIVAIHAEDEFIMQENKKTILGDSHDVAMHNIWRSPESCLNATKRVVAIAQKYNRRIHILHITTLEEMAFLRQHKDIATVEVLANHLTLHAPECYETLGSLAQQNPPIREKHHQDALWQAIADGTVDMVASDHAPHTLEEKGKPYPLSPSGTPGVQTLLPIMLNHVNQGKLSLERLVELMHTNPIRIHGINNRGPIATGNNADFTVVDMNKTDIISSAVQATKSEWTPFDGMQTKGWPVMTMIRGHVVMYEGELSKEPAGQPVLFNETVTPAN